LSLLGAKPRLSFIQIKDMRSHLTCADRESTCFYGAFSIRATFHLATNRFVLANVSSGDFF
jgi:hypothetical protein